MAIGYENFFVLDAIADIDNQTEPLKLHSSLSDVKESLNAKLQLWLDGNGNFPDKSSVRIYKVDLSTLTIKKVCIGTITKENSDVKYEWQNFNLH